MLKYKIFIRKSPRNYSSMRVLIQKFLQHSEILSLKFICNKLQKTQVNSLIKLYTKNETIIQFIEVNRKLSLNL